MYARHLKPILNVADIRESFAWFAKLGWTKNWEWGTPPTFGCVGSGECEIFLCHQAQGDRRRGALTPLHGFEGSEEVDQGSWVYLMVDDVDAVYRHCQEQGIEVAWPPTVVPWGVLEMHVRHPDGHVLRIGQASKEA